MVLVHVTTLKGRHKKQSWWENRKYVVEWQPYPNLPVYVVSPIDGQGCSCTIHRNYLLPISAIWNKKSVQFLWEEMGLLQCHTGVMLHMSTAQPGVDQKACLIHCQNRVNHSFQRQLGQLAQTQQAKDSRITVMHAFY